MALPDTESELYAGHRPEDLPAYPIGEVAGFLGVPTSTLRSWTHGRRYETRDGERFFEPIVLVPDPDEPLMSFTNLVEAHVLSAMRRRHGIRLAKIRSALEYVTIQLGRIDHPLARVEFETDGVDLFLGQLVEGQKISASEKGQAVIRDLLESHLDRIDRSPDGLACRLYPFTRSWGHPQPRSIEIDPRRAFGRPVLAGTGIPTDLILGRCKAGEAVQEIAMDYGCDPEQIVEAIRFYLPDAA